MFGYFAGSFLGYEIYYHQNENFAKSSFFISKLFALGIIFFFVKFYCFFKSGEIEGK